MSRVLLVDDDALLTELLTEYLTAEGLEVRSVPDGEAGVQEILSGQYDVVVLDSMMPKMNGLDVLKTVRAQSSIPIIMLTAKGDDIDRIIGLEMGADDYVPKPSTRANCWRVSTPFCVGRKTSTIRVVLPTACRSAMLPFIRRSGRPLSATARWN